MENTDIFNAVEEHGTWSMSDFQSRYFVVNSQVTNYRRVRQALLEIETRIASKKQVERSSKKTEIEKKIKLREYEQTIDDLQKELILLEIEQLDYDISVYEKRYRVILEELDVFAEIVKNIVDTAEDLEYYKKHDEIEEQNYWIARMGKQAAMDLMTIGRIGQGNMDSISMMPIEVQKNTVKAALKYNALLGEGMQALEKEAVEELQNQGTQLSYIDELVNDMLKLEEKVKGEDI